VLALSREKVEKASRKELKEYCEKLNLSTRGKNSYLRRRLLDFVKNNQISGAKEEFEREIKAIALSSYGFNKEALSLWKEILRGSEKSPFPWMAMGNEYLSIGDAQRAGKCY